MDRSNNQQMFIKLLFAGSPNLFGKILTNTFTDCWDLR